MECHCIPAVEIPHTAHLYSTYIQNFSSLAEFYSHAPTAESVRQVACGLRPDPAMRRGVAEVLRQQNRGFGGDASVEAAIERFAAGAAVIVSGQQTGLFSGPAYTIYKALHALRVADDLSASGTPAVAVFWLATEDHDLAEVDHCFWPTKGGAEQLELAAPSDPTLKGHRVGEIALGQPIEPLVEQACALLEGPAAPEIARALKESYAAPETYGSAFGKLLARLFAGHGLILLDALAPELHRLAAPVYRAAKDRHAELTQDLLARGKALEQAGFHAQVKVAERSTLLFLSDGQSGNGERQPLTSRKGEFVAGARAYSHADLEKFLAESPEVFSPNALLRPVVQDTLLGSAAIVAGPAEAAYYAQSSVIYRRLLGRMPVILQRASFTLVPPHLARLLRKYNLEFADLFEGRQALRKKMERDTLPPELAQQFDAGEKTLRELIEKMRAPIATLDPTLKGALENAESKIVFQFNGLRERVGRAIAFRSSVLDGHERELVEWLYPEGGLQERAICLLPLIASQGAALLDELVKRIPADGKQHQVLYL